MSQRSGAGAPPRAARPTPSRTPVVRSDLFALLYVIDGALSTGFIEPLGGDFPGLYVQSFGNDVLYDRVLGINVDGAPGDPGSLVQ